MEGSASRVEPSALKPEIVEGSILQSRQFNIPVGMELTTSSARQDTAPLSTILPDKKPATPATFVTSAPAGAMDNPALPRASQMNIQLASSGNFIKFAVLDDFHTKLQL